MRWRSFVMYAVVVALVSAGGWLATAGAQTADDRTGIRVTGQGSVAAQPNLATLNLGASVLRERPDEAFERLAALTAAATTYLREQGISETDIITSQLTLSQEFRPRSVEQPELALAGWRARHTLSVRIRDFTIVGRALSGAVAALEEAGEVQGISFTVENNQQYIDLARDAALADARQKAERIAARLGVQLGPVTFAQETSGSAPSTIRPTPSVPPPAERPAAAAATVAPQVAIMATEQRFSVTVEVHFSIAGALP